MFGTIHYYDLVSGNTRVTPAMEIGLSDHVWTIKEWIERPVSRKQFL